MPQATIDINDPADIDAAIAAAVNDVVVQVANMDLTSEMNQLIGTLQSQHNKMFDQERDDRGRRWARLSPVTVRKKGNDAVLIEFGNLERSLIDRNPNSVRRITRRGNTVTLEFGTRDEKSMVNQFGGESSSGGTIPARPHVGLTENSLDKFMNDLADSMVKRLQRNSNQVTT